MGSLHDGARGQGSPDEAGNEHTLRPATPLAPPAHLHWLTNLRAIAALCVVGTHVAAVGHGAFLPAQATPAGVVNVWLDAATKCGVPLFFMIIGALQCARPAVDLGKQLRRAAVPLAAYTLFYWAYRAGRGDLPADPAAYLGPAYYHLWFLYAVIPVYVALWFLRLRDVPPLAGSLGCLGLLAGLGPFSADLLAETTGIRVPLLLGAQADPMAYLLYACLGGFLIRLPRLSRGWLTGLFLAVLILPLGTLGATLVVSESLNRFVPGLISNFSPLVALQAVALFLLARGWADRKSRALAGLAAVSLGVYCLHPVIIDALLWAMPVPAGPQSPAWTPLAALVIVTLATWGCAWLLRRLDRGGLIT